MLSFLKLVFGPDITVKGFDYTDDTPYYIKDGYTPPIVKLGRPCVCSFEAKWLFLAIAYIKKAVEEVSGTLFSSLCTVLRQPVCVTTTEYAGRTHPVCVSFAAGVPSVLGVRFS